MIINVKNYAHGKYVQRIFDRNVNKTKDNNKQIFRIW